MGRNGKTSAKLQDSIEENSFLRREAPTSSRLDVNDLIKRRKEEKTVEKKNNIAIVSAVAVVATATVAIISLS